MKKDKKLPAIIYAGCGFSLLLVILVGVTSLYFSERQKQKEYRVEHTYQVLEKVHTVYHHLFEMGMDRQRFRSTGENSFFQSYNNHSDSLLNDLSLLQGLVVDNRGQFLRTIVLKQRISDLLMFWAGDHANLKDYDATSRVRFTLTEKEKLDKISLEIASMSDVERGLLKRLGNSNIVLRQWVEFTITAGILLILILVCFLIYFILQELKNRINAYEKEKEMNQLKSNFISLASHEFRTPLSSILLSTSLIDKYISVHDSANASKHSQKIKTTVGNMNSILEDFLSLEKLNAGKINPVFRHFDLVDLCEEITEEMQHIAKPGQTLSFEHVGTEKTVNLDRNLVRNAIVNLVANSVKYAGESAAIILKVDISADHVAISITDNGVGIAENEQKELFTPFYRINNTGNIPGTGLGLSIVSRYVNLMKGKLSFSSVPNKKTCFEMSFSLAS